MDHILKSEILVVVLEKPEGVSTGEFAGLFHQIHGYQFKLSNYGYKSLKTLLDDVKDLFQVIDASSECLIKCISPSEHKIIFISGNSTPQENKSQKSSNLSSANTPVLPVTSETENNKVPPPVSVADKLVCSSPTTGDKRSHKKPLEVLDEKGTTHTEAVDQVNENKCSAENQKKSNSEKSKLQTIKSCDKNDIMPSRNTCSVTNIPNVMKIIPAILEKYVTGLKCTTLKKLFKKEYKMDLETCSQSHGYGNVRSMLEKIPDIKLKGGSQGGMVCILKKFAHKNKQTKKTITMSQINNSNGKLNSLTNCVKTAEVTISARSQGQGSKTNSTSGQATIIESPAIPETNTLPSKPSQIQRSTVEKTPEKMAGNLQHASMNRSKGIEQKPQSIQDSLNAAQICNSNLHKYASYAQACVGIQKPQKGTPCNTRQETNLVCNTKPTLPMAHHNRTNPACRTTEPQDGLVNPAVKENIKDILQVHANGISIFNLQKCYLFKFGEPICSNGFSTVKQLLMEMKDVVVIRGLGVQMLLFPISATTNNFPFLIHEDNPSIQPSNSQPDNLSFSSKKSQVVSPDGQSSRVMKEFGAENKQFVAENTNSVTVLASAQSSCFSNFANPSSKVMKKNLLKCNTMSPENYQAGVAQLGKEEWPTVSDTRHMSHVEQSEEIIRPVQTEPQAEKMQESQKYSSKLPRKVSETGQHINKTDLQTELDLYKASSSKPFMEKTAFSTQSDRKIIYSNNKNAEEYLLFQLEEKVLDSTQKESLKHQEPQSSLSQDVHTNCLDSGQTEHLSQSLQKAHNPNHSDTARQPEHLSQSQLKASEPILVQTQSYPLQLLQKGPLSRFLQTSQGYLLMYQLPLEHQNALMPEVQTNPQTVLAQQPKQTETLASVSQQNVNKQTEVACSKVNQKMGSCGIHNQSEESAISTAKSQQKGANAYADNTSEETGTSSSKTHQNYDSQIQIGHEQQRLSGLKPCQKVKNHQQTREDFTTGISAKDEEPSWQTHKEYCHIL